MSGHTKGPWFLFGNGHCVGGPSGDDAEAIPTAGVAMCGMARRSPAECTANARLIAAAPDLLSALHTTRGNIASLGPAGAIPFEYREWLAVVDAAIANAVEPA